MSKDLARVKKLFFDRQVVVDATSRAERKVLSRFGAFTMRRAKSLTRKRKKPSAPGEPHKAKTGFWRDNVFFSYDPLRASVVIGPVVLNGKGGANLLRTLEEGGTLEERIFVLDGEGFDPATGEFRPARGRVSKPIFRRSPKAPKRKITIAARPAMKTAFDDELARMPPNWRNSIGRF